MMVFMPGYDQPSHPPPSRRSRRGLWIGFGIGSAVLCLCSLVVVAVVPFFGRNIPWFSVLFPSPTSVSIPIPISTPTPTVLFYNNPAAGISLIYPEPWQYSESGDAASGYTIMFASSADILNNSTSAPRTGAALSIMTNIMKTSDLSFIVNADSMGSVTDYIATDYFTNLSGGQNLRTFTLSGEPAASGVYIIRYDGSSPSAAYLIAVLRNDEIILFFGVCPQTEWSQYQPVFDSIVNSTSIVTP